MTQVQKQLILSHLSCPQIAPVREKDFFIGKLNHLEKIANAINKNDQHAVV